MAPPPLRPEHAWLQDFLLGRPGAEVARELGLSPNAVYIAGSRVRKRLRQFLAGLLE